FAGFLNGAPEPYSLVGRPGQGYCDYTAPSPDQSNWTPLGQTGFEPCFGPCPPGSLGCSQPNTPTANQFETWGDADYVKSQSSLYDSPQLFAESAKIAQALQYGAVLSGTGNQASLSAPMQAVGQDTTLLQDLSGFQSLKVNTANLANPSF